VANVSKKTSTESGITQLSPVKNWGWGVFLAILCIFILIALLDYNPSNYHVYPPKGDAPLLGVVGLEVARFIFVHLGVSGWFIPWFLSVWAWLFLTPTKNKIRLQKLIPFPLILIAVSIMANLSDHRSMKSDGSALFDQSTFEHGAGGSLGAWLYSGLPFMNTNEIASGGVLRVWIGEVGSWILASILLVLSLAVHCSFDYTKLIKAKQLLEKLVLHNQKDSSTEKVERPQESVKKKKNEAGRAKQSILKSFFKKPKNSEKDDLLFGDVSTEANDPSENKRTVLASPNEIKNSNPSPNKKAHAVPEEKSTSVPKLIEENQEELSKITQKVSLDDGFKVVRAEKTEKATDLFPERKGDYHFPTLDLLMEPPEVSSGGDEDHMIKAQRLKETLSEFKIDVELGEVHTGPVITRYDIHPAAGVRVEKIANLDKNLAMALRADSVRILAPVPGKGCVGVEVPNDMAAPVCLKEILESKAWADANAEIPIVLGKEASGKPLVADLTKMPHLLVAGSTGSGKTVCINAIIASLCYYSSPEDVRFIMVDPKIVEMKVYNDLPHMLIPVVTEPKKVPGALKWLLVEMERRYQIFSKIGVRNIAGFNAKILKDKEEKEKAQLLDAEMTAEERAALSSIQVPRDDDALEIPENKLPYIVCIIDELADLMMVAQADVETGIARLAQLARAAGIHLIIATQRPSVNVITGVIKANLPSRISFRVASYRDSQTILDGKGAESLIGKGDMLFIPPGSATFMRAQGAFVSDDEINGIVDYLKRNGPPQIIEEVREQIESAGEDDVLGSNDEESDDDPMLKKAVEIIRTTKRASTSNLQRKLSIGYNRAARIMDELEERGVVGPDIPGQGREILLDI